MTSLGTIISSCCGGHAARILLLQTGALIWGQFRPGTHVIEKLPYVRDGSDSAVAALFGDGCAGRAAAIIVVLSGKAGSQLCRPAPFDAGDDPNGAIPA